MRAGSVCNVADAPGLAERYVARQLSDQEAAAFEEHFLTCGDCQREVRLAAAVRAGLSIPRTAASDTPRHAGRWIGLGLALAAGIGTIIVLRSTSSAVVTSLGGVIEPPAYLGVTVRGTPGLADSIFDAAMTAYAARRYGDAVAGLRRAVAAGQDSVPTEFFLGASLLMSGEPRDAAAAFNRVLARGDTPYRDDAQLYEAKALLRLGRGREALDVLTGHTPADPVTAATLSALADSVSRALGVQPRP